MSLNEQAEGIRRSIEFIRNGSLGIVTDGDKFLRPMNSMRKLINADYDVEANKIVTRNGTVESDLLDGFVMPAGYEIMTGGCQTFSFNAPVDRKVVILFIKHTVSGNVRVYINTWFNPPAPNTDPVGSNNDYENYISGQALGWHDEWIEITEHEEVRDFTISAITNPSSIVVDGSALEHNGQVNYYRGWFAWNATKWNSGDTDKIKNESFVAIEGYDGANTLTIQNRLGFALEDLTWADGDKVYLIRYPIIVNKAQDTTVNSTNLTMNFTPYGNNWIQKSNVSIKCLIGQAGNLWFGFLNKDLKKISNETTYDTINKHKYYGWWVDYETPPNDYVVEKLQVIADQRFILPPYLGVYYIISGDGAAGDDENVNIISCSLQLNYSQNIGVLKAFESTKNIEAYYIVYLYPFHHYSRRITGSNVYSGFGTQALDDTRLLDANIGTHSWHRVDTDTYIYRTIYDYSISPLTKQIVISDSPTRHFGDKIGTPFEAVLGYTFTEKIYTADKFGVLADDILFTGGEDEKPDRASFSAIQDGVPSEDIFPLANRKNVGSADKDKLIFLTIFGKIVVAFKNNSIHLFTPKGDGEGWRLLTSKAKTGTRFHQTIASTTLGITYNNEDGVWLFNLDNSINITKESRQGEYYELNPEIMFCEWYEHKQELWMYVGEGLFWILKFSQKTRQLGWKEYQFPVAWEIIDIITDEESTLHIICKDKVIRFLKDTEQENGNDFGNIGIDWTIRENLMLLREQEQTRHRRWKILEHKIYTDYTRRDGLVANGNTEIINYKMYVNEEEVYDSDAIGIDLNGAYTPETLNIRNTRALSHRAFAIELSGTLTYCKKIAFSEFFSRAMLLGQPIKSGLNKVVA